MPEKIDNPSSFPVSIIAASLPIKLQLDSIGGETSAPIDKALENKKNADEQLNRLRQYASAKGYIISSETIEIGSGINDNRKKFLSLLKNPKISKIIVEHKDRATRFGFNYLEALLPGNGKSIEVINQVDNDKEDLVQDFVSIITSFCARIYGAQHSKRKIERIVAELTNDKKTQKKK